MNIENKYKEYKTDGTYVYSCQYHVIFTTKYRRKVWSQEIVDIIKQLIIDKQLEYNYKVLDMEVMNDHVHLLIDVDPKKGIYPIVCKIKGYTSKALREEFPELKKRLPTLWTRSKFIATVGSANLEVVKKYIEEQKKNDKE